MFNKLLKQLIILPIVILMTTQSSFAEIQRHAHSIGLANESQSILLVGLNQYELAQKELGLLNKKKIIEITRTENWVDSISKSDAKEIIVKHNSGFAGLYSPSGQLIRPVELADGSNPIQKDTLTGSRSDLRYLELQNQVGYQTGGPIDPYQGQRYVSQYANNAKLSPGWGYNSQYDQPRSKRSAVVDFLNFMPIDTTTPINYAGQFTGNRYVSTAYTLGVLPHIAGLVTRMKRGSAERKDYEFYKRENSIPNYLDRAPDFYYQGAYGEETNPITTDPNFIRYDNAPQAFKRAYPTYGYAPNPNFISSPSGS